MLVVFFYLEIEMRVLYTALFYLLLPFVFIRLLWRSRNLPGYRKNWTERLGYVSHVLEHSIWVHAVSVGETIAAIPLIKAIQKAYPTIPIVVTNMTPTGAERVKAAFGDTVLQSFVPYDIPAFLSRFIKRIKPKILIVMETELWPNLFATCLEHQVPIIVTNARLSEKSARGYARIPFINHDMFKAMHRLAAQTDADAERFVRLGLSREKIVVTGNLKFDLEIADDLFLKSEKLREEIGRDRLIWIAASTHQGEEEIMLQAHRLILEKYPEALLMLVPRHPNRFDEVKSLVLQKKFTMACRSEHAPVDASVQVFMGDSMGELMLFYASTNVALVGGSFVGVGGHNMLEPAALHKPILTGPIVFNFTEISQLLLQAQGMLMVKNAEEIAYEVTRLFSDENLRHRLGENAYNVVASNRGALERQVALVKQILM